MSTRDLQYRLLFTYIFHIHLYFPCSSKECTYKQKLAKHIVLQYAELIQFGGICGASTACLTLGVFVHGKAARFTHPPNLKETVIHQCTVRVCTRVANKTQHGAGVRGCSSLNNPLQPNKRRTGASAGHIVMKLMLTFPYNSWGAQQTSCPGKVREH